MRKHNQLQETLDALEWWLKWPALIGATITAGIILCFRIEGLLSPQDYPFAWIGFQWFVAGTAFPRVLMLLLRSTNQPMALIWYQRIGAVVVFCVLPSVFLFALHQWLSK